MDTSSPTPSAAPAEPSNTDIAREAAACGLPPEQFDQLVGGEIIEGAAAEPSEDGEDSLTQGLAQA